MVKELSAKSDEAKNQLIIFEPIHAAGDKAYKMVQYRKLNGKDLHQLIFINQTSEYLQSCFDLPGDGQHFYFGFKTHDIISVTTHNIRPFDSESRRYLYTLQNYIPFNSNDIAKWMDESLTHEEKINILGKKLTDHTARLLSLLGHDYSKDLSIELYDDTINQDIGSYKSTGFSHFDLVFASNIFIPTDLNIGRRAATHGILTLHNG